MIFEYEFIYFLENPPEPLTSTTTQQSTEILKQPVPVYIPTPKHLLEARKANGSSRSDECSASKRPKLEYVPKAITNNSTPIPTYVPSSVPSTTNDEYEPSTVCAKNAVLNDNEADSNGDDIMGLLTELSSEQITNNENQGNCMTIESKASKNLSDLEEPKEQKSKENSHKSSSSSSRHRHHSHKSSHSDRKGSSSSKSSSSTHKSSHHSSSHKSKHSDKDKDKHLDKDKDRDKAKSRHSSKSSKDTKHKSSEHRSKSSSSSRRHSSSHHSEKKTHSSNSNSSNKPEDCITNSIAYETESEDDDVEAQCRLIFEEFDPSTIETKTDETLNGLSSPSAEDEGNDASNKIDDTTKKKRVAHDNADKHVKSIATFRRHSDHVKNAMQVRHSCLKNLSTQICDDKYCTE